MGHHGGVPVECDSAPAALPTNTVPSNSHESTPKDMPALGGRTDTERPVVIRTDAAPHVGVGHAMRMLALSQELIGRGVPCILVGEASVAWVTALYESAGVQVRAAAGGPDELAQFALSVHARAVVLDRYTFGPEYGETLRSAGLRVMAVVDGDFGAQQVGDIYLDQNPGATPHATNEGEIALAGASYTLFRDSLLTARRNAHDLPTRDDISEEIRQGTHAADTPVRVLAVFGGTDPFHAGETIVPLILATGLAVHVTLVRPEGSQPLIFDDLPPHQHVEQVGPLRDLPATALASDFVISAAGTSVWELMCLGAPLGVVCVVDNQVPGYHATVQARIATGVAVLDDVRTNEAARRTSIDTLRDILTNATARREMAIRAQSLLDGRGRERVADVLLNG